MIVMLTLACAVATILGGGFEVRPSAGESASAGGDTKAAKRTSWPNIQGIIAQ